MTAYNKINGVHVSESKEILQGILRDEWKWDGCTMSDWYGTYSTKEPLDAGLNLEMPGPTRFRQLLQTVHAVQANLIHPKVIDDNVRQVLKLINQGLKAGIPADVVESANYSPEASALLRKVGDESIVLLKNEEGILPLSKTAKETIAVIGPNAKASQDSGGGSASLTATYKTTPYGGIEAKVKEGGNTIDLQYALGAFLDKNVPDSVSVLENEKGEKGLITARFYHEAPGTADRKPFEDLSLNTTRLFLSDFKSPNLPIDQLLYYVDFTGYFTPDETSEYTFGCSVFGTAQIFVDGKLVVDNKTKQVKGDAFFLGMGTREERGSVFLEKGRKYHVKVEFATSPTYTLEDGAQEQGGVYFGVQIKSSPEDEIAKAVKVAKSADKVVLVVGLSKEWESEGFDRKDMDIPGYTNKLVEAVAEVNPNIIVVNQSGSPVTLPWADKTKALVHAWYGGNELGNTIADVLFGDHNPSGKLSVSFPKRLEDNPSYINFGSNKGQVWYGEDVFVGYRYYEKVGRDVLYPFGYGLSYTSFDFQHLKVNADGESLVVKVDVTNTGKVAGAETVQLYIEQANPSINRPVKELKDFAKVFLNPGETKTVELELSVKEATSYWNSFVNQWQSDKDTYKVLVGNSSDNILLTGQFATTKNVTWTGL
ncbi:uncharacterized protein SPAPADRAFT_58631 [Spathaspora passalidarum NRRL Y-27907]|uniref:beta-glucosidase n=1 Tax=Spathaspora passalidarum (strain NRRL Y-27907 / 11-Y1) TaxID=619300 RepID=G3AGT2_SPAPN|nr:uncharacterized protein SPAPADRAFT_58631 [Spathaspora passalidarum NRRL Y-27907]EGW35415.1 hypothetical protein SPAPADRAFT_58631 [Spathaspora passalidarum NRRL Y-27907]